MITDAQRIARMEGIGGSDIPWLLGCYEGFTHDDGQPKSAYTLWQAKTGQREPDEPTMATTRGNDREPIIRSAVSVLMGTMVTEWRATVYHPRHEWMLCHPDGCIDEHNGNVNGILEIKRPSAYSKLREEWMMQLLWNMACTGCTWGHLAWEYDGKDGSLTLTISPRIEAEPIDDLIELTRRFWRCVQRKEWDDQWMSKP